MALQDPETRQSGSAPAARSSGSGAWAGFLAMAFAVVALMGVLGTYAAPIPLERALSRNAALDAVLVAARAPDAAAALEQLRPELSDSAGPVLGGPAAPAAIDARVAAERERVNHAFLLESADIGLRLRVVICAFAAAGALFGLIVLSVVRRSR